MNAPITGDKIIVNIEHVDTPTWVDVRMRQRRLFELCSLTPVSTRRREVEWSSLWKYVGTLVYAGDICTEGSAVKATSP